MKKSALILVGAIAFDLGVVVATGHAASDGFWQTGVNKQTDDKTANAAPQAYVFMKFDTVNTPQSCMTRGGKTASQNGVQGCLLPGKDGPASISDQGSGGVITSYKH